MEARVCHGSSLSQQGGSVKQLFCMPFEVQLQASQLLWSPSEASYRSGEILQGAFSRSPLGPEKPRPG